MDRRHFIKLTAISGTTAALTACGNPENQVIRFIPEDELVPGLATWKPSVCPLCDAGCGVIARVMEGDAEVFRNGQAGVIRMGLVKKLEGNPEDPISQGKLCARGQAALQVTYHPDRLDKPRKRSGERGSGQYVDVSWDEAIKELTGQLDALAAANDQRSLAFLTRPRPGRRLELIAQVLQRYGAPAPAAFEVFSDEVLRRANAASFGAHQLPTFDLEHAKYVLVFGADVLGTWNSVVAHSVAYGRMRQGGAGARAKLVYVDARLSQTGANADEFVAIKPGTDGVLASGIARAVAEHRGSSAGAWPFTLEEVEARTGVAAATVQRLGREFATHGPSLAIIGGAALAHTNGLFNAAAVNNLNIASGALNQPGGVSFVPQRAPATTRPFNELLQGPPAKVLLIDDVNPVYGSPSAVKVADSLQRIPFIVSFGPFIDETSALADLILPDHSFLESWVDAAPESGAAKAAPSKFGPVMRPLYDTRSTPDVLLDVSRKLATPLAGLPASFEEFLNQEPATDVRRATALAAAKPAAAGLAPAKAAALQTMEPQFDGDAAQYPYHLIPYASQALYDGSLAHLPWLQELPDPMTSGMWCSWVEINEKKAEELGIHQGDLIEVSSTQGSLRAPAFLSPGIAPDAIAIPVGQGHTNFTRYATNRGVNPIAILAAVPVPETGTLAWAATRVRIARAGGPDESLILFGGATRERPEWTHGRGDEH
jgi:anaerobic selenocysteine-containing dehydrogenase